MSLETTSDQLHIYWSKSARVEPESEEEGLAQNHTKYER